ncbi:hypothetical protein BC829DRAFT_393837 [Chytridium lagenaria]|nr:hypothetical protein BC829DRAFT_393837 [Chytridium lagenaria]
MFEPAFIIDVLAIFPFYLEIIISLLTGTSVVSGATAVEGFAALRVLRLLRVVRLFKIFERSPQLRILSVALSKSYDGIMILAIVSPLLFYAEQTDEYYKDGVWYYTNGDRSPFQSITSCFWLSIVTLTTVGYGDVTPRTTLGRLVSAVASLAALQEKKAEIRRQNVEDQARRDSITQQALFAFQEKAGRLSPGIPAVGPSSASPSVSSSPTRGSYISYKAQAAKLLDMARSDDVVTLRLAVNGEEGFRKVLQLLSDATASTSS